jgi:hypothetical protein
MRNHFRIRLRADALQFGSLTDAVGAFRENPA